MSLLLFQSCTVIGSTRMICNTPTISTLLSTAIDPEHPLPLSFGFRLDGVTSLRNWTRTSGDVFLVYPDPSFEQFADDVKTFQPDSDYLTINVSHMTHDSFALLWNHVTLLTRGVCLCFRVTT